MSKFRILSIDGGGIKGLYTSSLLKELEETYGSLGEHFDLITGTSTGAIIASAIAFNIPMEKVCKLYEEKGNLIFPNDFHPFIKNAYRNLRQVFWGGKYDSKELKNALESVFGDNVLGDSNKLLCIPSFNLSHNRTSVFKKPHSKLKRDQKTKIVDVLLASSAAPTYFPIHSIDDELYIDGGIWANNPGMVGFMEAIRFFNKEKKEISILSIACLEKPNGWTPHCRKKRSFAGWRDSLFDAVSDAQNFSTNYFLETIQQSEIVENFSYKRIKSPTLSHPQYKLVSLDCARLEALKLLRSKGKDIGLQLTTSGEIDHFFK